MNQRLAFILSCAFLIVAAGASRAQQATVHESPHKNLKRTCEKCHVATSFRDIRFDHGETGYELSGLHSQAKCLDCHNVEDFSKVEPSCGTCHQDIHRSRLGNDCERCHAVSGWSVFDAENIHENTNFPIQGRHLLLDCLACHPGMPAADFRRVWTGCYECHRADYENTLVVDHRASGFPVVCQNCHEMTGWTPAFMPDHDTFFPIFSGTHNKKWSECAECHVVPGNFRIFECIQCHEHNQADMDPKHQGIPGYAYNSPACYSCHPTGEAGDFGDHDGLFFPIFSGTHNRRWDNCSECHPTPANRSEYTCLTCHDHLQADMDPVHQGMDGYAYNSLTCLGCHPTGDAGDFRDHDGLFFPIFSGPHNGSWDDCLTCHPTPTNKKEFTCISCHQHDRTLMDNEHIGEVDGYEYNSAACYDCHPNGIAEEDGR